MNRAGLVNSIPWNLFLITLGSLVYSTGINGVVIHHNFITSGIYGLALLIYYESGTFSPSFWYFICNLPLFILGWFFVSRRFFYYTLYGVLAVTFITRFMPLDFQIEQQIYAAVAGGIICGIGSGITLRSLGSAGGLDIIAVILYSRYNIGMGKVSLVANVLLFSLASTYYNPDILIASIILVFISSVALEQVLSLFNQRKVVYVITDFHQEIFDQFKDELRQGATFLKAQGAFSGKDKYIIMTIINNIQLKRLESIVFGVDEDALFIVEDSFNVLGSNFGKRKIY
ncbi:MAG: YitT family protein [Desulfobulbaceae bacterium]|nr:YitT family protein [Desulfobulbaceae bacterium]